MFVFFSEDCKVQVNFCLCVLPCGLDGTLQELSQGTMSSSTPHQFARLCKIWKAHFSFCSFSPLALPPHRCISWGVSGEGLLFQTHTIACCPHFSPELAQGTGTTSYFHLYQLHTRDLNSSLSLYSAFFFPLSPENSINAKLQIFLPSTVTNTLPLFFWRKSIWDFFKCDRGSVFSEQ